MVSRRKPAPGKHEDLQLDVHHLFDAHTQPYLAALDVLHNELGHFQGSASTQKREERRQQQLMQSLELLQARFEGNHLLY